jgi:hypothetical protein
MSSVSRSTWVFTGLWSLLGKSLDSYTTNKMQNVKHVIKICVYKLIARVYKKK